MADDVPAAGDKSADSSVITYNLRKPVKAFGDEIKALTFAEPTALDIEAVGLPVILDFKVDPPLVTFDQRAMSAMMARLAKVPASTISALHPKDWTNAAWTLSGFFTPDLGS